MHGDYSRRHLVVLLSLTLSSLGVMSGFFSPGAHALSTTEIKIDNFAFAPQTITVSAGTTMTWINHDDIPHSVVEKNTLFHSKALDTNDSYSFTFKQAGSYDYFCGLHPHMTGKIIVKP